jgi:exopolyphosphatase/guanosine-5'-triphosphate,3'-diphosphate pyrophosphatase
VVDIGGGSLEIGAGQDEEPEAVMSLPLGAGRLTRDWFTSDPPPPDQVRALRRHVRAEIARMAGSLRRGGTVDHAVGTSKTFRQLARIAGAAPSSEGFYARRFLSHADVGAWAERLASMEPGERSRLPGVSEGRAAQMTAGAIVADAVMDLMGVAQLEICPWALREGVILKRLDNLTDPTTWSLTGPMRTLPT